MFGATFASVPMSLLEDTVGQAPLEDGFSLVTDSYSAKVEEISSTKFLGEVSLIYILRL